MVETEEVVLGLLVVLGLDVVVLGSAQWQLQSGGRPFRTGTRGRHLGRIMRFWGGSRSVLMVFLQPPASSLRPIPNPKDKMTTPPPRNRPTPAGSRR